MNCIISDCAVGVVLYVHRQRDATEVPGSPTRYSFSVKPANAQ